MIEIFLALEIVLEDKTMRQIYGFIKKDGQISISMSNSEDFTVKKTGVGWYNISFDKHFTKLPIVMITTSSPYITANAICQELSTTNCTIITGYTKYDKGDDIDFSFIVQGE